MAPKRVVVIANPATRRNVDSIISLLYRRVQSGVELDVCMTTGAGSATELTLAALPGADLVVAVGGDGTVGEVATALCGTDVPLGIVPAGSTNIVARELHIPLRATAAVDLLFSQHRRTVLDMGQCGSRCFLHMAGAGFDSRMFAATNRNLKRRIGWLAYGPPAMRHLFHPPSHYSITADGFTLDVVSPLVLIANGGSIIAPWLTLYPEIRKDDGLLDVLVFTPKGGSQVARTLRSLAIRRLETSPYVQRMTAQHVEIYADPPVLVQLDGDVHGPTPATFSVLPRALQVISPTLL